MMDKFKMELTWHNCKTHPPREVFNPWLIYTNGYNIDSFAYYNKYGFPVPDDELHEYWWADLSRTVRESNEFKEIKNA
jgi:hypothetical protein